MVIFSKVVLGSRIHVSFEQVEAAFPDLTAYATHHDSLVNSIAALKATKRKREGETAARGT